MSEISEENLSDEDRLKEVIRLLKLAIEGCQSALADIEEKKAGFAGN